MTDPRKTKAYAAWRRQVLAQCEPTCIRCGYPVDMALPSTHDDGPSADHEPPLIETGDPTPGMDGSGIAHLKCNKSHGGRIGAARRQARPTAPRPRSRSLQAPQSPPAAPSRVSPRKGGSARRTPQAAPVAPDGFVLPRIETRRIDGRTGTYGPEAAAWLVEVYGLVLRPWQRYALDRALEHEGGVLTWSTVIVTVARQSGKSVLARAICMWRLHHADLFGEPQTILHVANKRATAMEVMRPAAMWAVEKYGKKAAKFGNENTGIHLPSGDRWLIHAANESAGVGYSVGMALVDEAWRISRSVVDDSIGPTMAEREQPQLWLVSTAGDSSSDLMTSYRQRAIDALDAPDPGSVLILEWSAPQDADPDLEDTWKWASPEWSDKRANFLRQQHGNVEESAWRREYLNQWVTSANHWMRDSWWESTLDADTPMPDGTWSVALESDFSGMGHAVACAAPNEAGEIVVRVTTHRTIAEADARLAELRAAHPALYVQVTPGYIDRLREHFDTLVGSREAVAATQTMLDLFDRRMVRHDGSVTLREHFANSTIARRSAGWALSAPAGRGGVYAARAVMFAMAQASKTPRPVPVIHSRRPS